MSAAGIMQSAASINDISHAFGRWSIIGCMSSIKPKITPLQVESGDCKPRLAGGRVGCVSYLNSKPLIHGLGNDDGLSVQFDVPSRLLADLESGEVDIALCPIVDYFRSSVPLVIVPVGGICCDGPTMTVCVFSKVPLNEIVTVHADTDSHTSVALMQVILHEKLGRLPDVVDYNAKQEFGCDSASGEPQTVLLIGDKVVTNGSATDSYPYSIDLGQAWNELTGQPFVFATWLARRGTCLGELPKALDHQRIVNESRLVEIADCYADSCSWPRDMARLYLEQRIKYEVGDRQLKAVETFAGMAGKLGVISDVKSLDLWRK